MIIRFKNIIKFFFISLVIGLGISYGKIYLFHLAIVSLVLGILSFKMKKFKLKVPIQPTKYHYVFYFFLTWYTISILWSLKPSYSLYYLIYLSVGLLIVLSSVFSIDGIDSQNKLFKVIAVVFVFEIGFSLLEAFTDFRLPISPYSNYVSFFGRENKVIGLGDNILAYIYDSPTGFRWNPNNLALTMLIIHPFFFLHKKKIVRLFGVSSILILVLMTGSRGVLIAVFFQMMLYFLLYNFQKSFKYILLSPFFILIFISQVDNLKKSEIRRVKEAMEVYDVLKVYLFDDSVDNEGSIGSRRKLISNGVDALIESNYIGVGGGASIFVQEKKGGVSSKEYTSMHNFWVELLVEGGVLFFIIFVFWYMKVVLNLYSISIRSSDDRIMYFSKSLFLSMSAFIVGVISASSAIYFFPMWLMFGFSIATINNYIKLQNEGVIISGV